MAVVVGMVLKTIARMVTGALVNRSSNGVGTANIKAATVEPVVLAVAAAVAVVADMARNNNAVVCSSASSHTVVEGRRPVMWMAVDTQRVREPIQPKMMR